MRKEKNTILQTAYVWACVHVWCTKRNEKKAVTLHQASNQSLLCVLKTLVRRGCSGVMQENKHQCACQWGGFSRHFTIIQNVRVWLVFSGRIQKKMGTVSLLRKSKSRTPSLLTSHLLPQCLMAIVLSCYVLGYYLFVLGCRWTLGYKGNPGSLITWVRYLTMGYAPLRSP